MTCTFTDHPRNSVSKRVRFTYPDLLRVQEPVMATTSIEVHALASRAGLPCHSCASPSLVEVDLVLADAGSLAVIGRYTAAECQSCGADEVTR